MKLIIDTVICPKFLVVLNLSANQDTLECIFYLIWSLWTCYGVYFMNDQIGLGLAKWALASPNPPWPHQIGLDLTNSALTLPILPWPHQIGLDLTKSALFFWGAFCSSAYSNNLMKNTIVFRMSLPPSPNASNKSNSRPNSYWWKHKGHHTCRIRKVFRDNYKMWDLLFFVLLFLGNLLISFARLLIKCSCINFYRRPVFSEDI